MRTLFIIGSLFCCNISFAQLKATPTCPPLNFDVLEGTINKLSSKSTQGEITKTLPCATDVLEEDSAKCAGVFLKDKGILFYTDRDYIEVRDNYSGKSSVPLMGAARNSLFSTLGNPKLKDATWEAYQMQYGTLVVYFNAANKINKIQVSTRNSESLKLCE